MPINQPATGGTSGGGSGTMTTVKDEGVNLSTAVVSLDFVGVGVTATGTTAVSVLIPGAISGTLAGRPAATAVPGAAYYATDEKAAYFSDGATWTVLVFDGTAIDPGSIGPTELASTAVAAGTYGTALRYAIFTVDADGRLTNATSGSSTWKFPVRAATTVAGTLASGFENGDTIDGVVLATGDRVLLKNQAAGAENGIYTVNASGAPTRALDYDVAAEIVGSMCVVREGTVNADTVWLLTNNGTLVIGTTALVYAQHPNGQEMTALPAASVPLLGADTFPVIQAGVVGQAPISAAQDIHNWKRPVRVATTAAGTLASDFENGDTIDGVVLATGDRVLLKNQATAADNGVYTVNASGAPTRATDFNDSVDVLGAVIPVAEGTVNADSVFFHTTNAPITVGVTSLTFAAPDHNKLGNLATGDVHTQYAFLAGRSGGQVLIGGTAAGDDLTLRSTSNATRGTIFADDPIELQQTNATFTALQPVIFMDGTYTLDFAAIQFGPMINFAATLICEQDGSAFFRTNLFSAIPTIKNPAGETRILAPFTSLFDSPTFSADTTTGNTANHIGVNSAPTFTRTSTGTLTGSSSTGFSYNPTVNAGATLDTVTGILLGALTVGGAITSYVGVDIARQGDTDIVTSIGIRNADRTVWTPVANTAITAVSGTIRRDATLVTLTANNSYTLTSAPTIADGVDGQELIVLNVDTTDTITIQDQGTLANSNLRLGATTRALQPRDSIRLIYSSTIGDWVEVGFTNVT